MLNAKHCKAGQQMAQVKRETLKTGVQILSVICGKLDISFGEWQKTSGWAEQPREGKASSGIKWSLHASTFDTLQWLEVSGFLPRIRPHVKPTHYPMQRLTMDLLLP
jgi:hypothetical protein